MGEQKNHYNLKDRTDGLDTGIMQAVSDAWTRNIRLVYDRGYQDGKLDGEESRLSGDMGNYQKGYNAGTEDLRNALLQIVKEWESMKRMSVFGYSSYESVLTEYSAEEIIKRVKEDNTTDGKEDEIHIGDEVVLNDKSSRANNKGVVIANDELEYPYNVLFGDGCTEWVMKAAIERKTGRSFLEVVNFLNAIKEDEDE